MGKRALLVANGDPVSDVLLRSLVEEAAVVVAADGGVRHLVALGIQPDVVVGDLDSLTDELREKLEGADLQHDADQEGTDTSKALDYLIARGHTGVTITCAGGGRADHALSNLALLYSYRGAAEIRILDDSGEATYVEGSVSFDAPVGQIISLLPFSDAHGVTTEGLVWALKDETIKVGPRGVSNLVESSPVQINIRDGGLFLFKLHSDQSAT